MIDLTRNEAQILKNAAHCRERNIKLPTFSEMKNPGTISEEIRDEMKSIGLWDMHPRNLYRVSWKNEPVSEGGGYGKVNSMIIPREITGVKANIIGLVGKWFPT